MIFPFLYSKTRKATCHKTLLLWNTFYQGLNQREQKKFIYRTLRFVGDSKFLKGKKQEPSLEVKTIISGAFIQMTFGLRKYLLNQYNTIYIASKPYSYKHTDAIYHGDVNTKTKRVTLSWPKVKEGFAIPDDALNLCIHEFGHCLYIEQTERGGFFKDSEWNKWHVLAKPIMHQLNQNKSSSLRKYGASNFLEFFSVSLETYFENPDELNSDFPEYFAFLQYILNQK